MIAVFTICIHKYSSLQFYLIPMKCIIYINVCILIFFIYVYGQLSAIKNLLLLNITISILQCTCIFYWKYIITVFDASCTIIQCNTIWVIGFTCSLIDILLPPSLQIKGCSEGERLTYCSHNLIYVALHNLWCLLFSWSL